MKPTDKCLSYECKTSTECGEFTRERFFYSQGVIIAILAATGVISRLFGADDIKHVPQGIQVSKPFYNQTTPIARS